MFFVFTGSVTDIEHHKLSITDVLRVTEVKMLLFCAFAYLQIKKSTMSVISIRLLSACSINSTTAPI